jgi:hypothetical protein
MHWLKTEEMTRMTSEAHLVEKSLHLRPFEGETMLAVLFGPNVVPVRRLLGPRSRGYILFLEKSYIQLTGGYYAFRPNGRLPFPNVL